MATSSQPLTAKGRFSAKHALFLVLGVMTLFIIYRDEAFIVDHSLNTWTYFQPVRWQILVHGIAGAIALLPGASQFSSRLRQRYPALHRVFGRSYIAGVLVAAPTAVYLAFTHGPPVFAVRTAVQSSLWVVTALMALLAALNRNFEVHRQWVMRSYAVTLIFIVSRILFHVPVFGRLSDVGANNLLWILNICALLVPQVIINWSQLTARSVR